jgi:hypothetical protein
MNKEVLTMSKTISALQASRSLLEILNQVLYQGKTFEIKRGKDIIAKITPPTRKAHVLNVSELNDLFKNKLPSLEKKDIDAFKHDVKQIRENSQEKNPWD